MHENSASDSANGYIPEPETSFETPKLRRGFLAWLVAVCLSITCCGGSGSSGGGGGTSSGGSRSDTALVGPYVVRALPDRVTIAWRAPAESSDKLEFEASSGVRGAIIPETIVSEGDAFRRAEVSGLGAATSIRYSIVSGESPQRVFMTRTAPAAGAPARIAAYGDSQSHVDVHLELSSILNGYAPDLVLHTGDSVDNGGSARQWEDFFGSAAYASSIPILASPGNHEAADGLESFFNYYAAYYGSRLPLPGVTEHYVGDTAIIALNSQLTLNPGDPMRLYLEEALARAASASGIRHILVSLHFPVYSWGTHESSEYWDPAAREEVHQILRRYRVTAVLSGHNHSYERFERDGISYLTLGGGGANLHDPFSNVEESEAPFHRTAAEVHHFALLESAGEDLNVRIIQSPEGTLVEGFTIAGIAG